jgi:hypothetical protein
MSEPWWKKLGEVAIEIAAATVVIVTTVFIERCLRTGSDEPLDLDDHEERPRSVGSRADD